MKTLFLAVLLFISFAAPALATEQKESAFDRVMRTGTIRCGYFIFAPMIAKDANTGQISGVLFDYVEELGKALNLKIEWAQEADFATYLTDINVGRYDMECSGGFPNAVRGKMADYSKPIAFAPSYLYARASDSRFDANLERVNQEDVRFSLVDGDSAQLVHARRFPKASVVTLSSGVPITSIVLDVINNKSDVAFIDAMTGENLIKEYKGKLKRIPSDPVRIIPINMTLPKGDVKFSSMINTAHGELENDGVIDAILEKYDPSGKNLLRVAKPYEVSK